MGHEPDHPDRKKILEEQCDKRRCPFFYMRKGSPEMYCWKKHKVARNYVGGVTPRMPSSEVDEANIVVGSRVRRAPDRTLDEEY